MLTIAECKEYLDADTSATLSDDEVARVRDVLYALARVILASRKMQKNEYESERLD